MSPSSVFRVVVVPLVGVVFAVLGWSWHGRTESVAAGGETAQISPADAPDAAGSATASGGAKRPPTLPRSGGAEREVRISETMEGVFNADPNDLVAMMEAFGTLTQLSDDQVQEAWDQFSQRVPSNNFGGGLTVLYLWSRMLSQGEKVALPKGWGAEEFEVAVASETARHGGEKGREEILKRLEGGGAVSDLERRVIFGQEVRKNPLEAVKLWCRTTKPGDYQRDAPWMFTAMSDGGSRDAVMAELRKWQTGGDLAGVVSALAGNWMDRDPAAVEQWAREPAQADIKDVLMKEIIATRARANPVETWSWSQSLPEQERRQALGLSAAQFAGVGPAEAQIGIQLIGDLKDPQDRVAAIKSFGEALAGNNLDQWKQWRDTLSPGEQDVANEAGFDMWVTSDPDSAVAWLNARPSGDLKDRMVSVLASVYAKQNPQAAAQWIRSIPDQNRRREAVSLALTNAGTADLGLVKTILSGLSTN